MRIGYDRKEGNAMHLFTADFLRHVGIALFTACGAPADEAAVVAEELVEASLMGIDSHGVIRYIWYTEEAIVGRIKPGAPIEVVKQSANTAVVDFHGNFGPVGARYMADLACDKAREADIACIISKHAHHVGRLGSCVQRLAERGMIGLAVVNSSKIGHNVVPWGGRAGRLATNPLAYAVPTAHHPVILDMSTSMIAEGKIRVLLHQGKDVPPGCILDADGRPATDPRLFYGPPRGAILPFGSELGYKGFGLALLVEILGGALAGERISDEGGAYINGLNLIAINPEAFCGTARLLELMEEMTAYITDTPPADGFAEVVMPGAYDFRTKERRMREGIPVPEETWKQIVEAGNRVGLTLEIQ